MSTKNGYNIRKQITSPVLFTTVAEYLFIY